ncbi:MAG: carbohydrate-binding protein, partial [Verrucomicrobiota bacterium]
MKVKELSKIIVLISMGVMLMGQSPVPTNLSSGYPHWWFERDVIQRLDAIGDLSPVWAGSYPTQEDKAAFNIGQLKHVAAAARDEMEVRLSGGAGAEINSLVNSWTAVSPGDTDAVAVGQLKYVASIFLQRLDAVGYADPLSGVTVNESPSDILASWGLSGASNNDKDLAVIGQLKYLFSWDLSTFSSSTGSAGNGMDDDWELASFAGLEQDGALAFDGFLSSLGPTNAAALLLGSPHMLPGVIEAEDYDIGANGVAYLDTTTGNAGNEYRNDDVDIETTADTEGGYNVAWATEGEYLSYTVNVAQAGPYNITARVATGLTTVRNFHIEIDGVNLGNMSLLRNNSNKGWQNWTDVTLENVHLSAGEQEMRFVFDNGRLNLNKLTFMQHVGHGGHVHATSVTSVSDNINDFATHVAMQNGDWSDPDTWMMGNVPDDGAIVHIHHGVDVTYSSNDASTHIFYIHVDGNLNITSGNGTTRLQVDTIVTTHGSELNIDGTSGNLLDIVINPYDSNRVGGLSDGEYTANGETVDDGFGVLGRYAWDPQQMSLGIITEGKVDIKGKEKIGHLEMSETGQDGDDFISIDVSKYNLGNNSNLTDIQNEIGWSLGDIIVVGSTKYYRPDDQKTYDEQTTISSLDIISGKLVVGLEDKLKYDHEVTELDADSNGSLETRLSPTVINLSKNVQIRSEVSTDTDGNGYVDSVEMGVITQNGHTMFMHTTDVSIQDVNFAGLGRTDKSTPIDDLDTQGNAEDSIDITNHRGRYSAHLHMNGFMESGDKNLDDDIVYGGAYLSGNLVWGSPGWGMTHHAGLATLTDNVTYDIFGAGFVSETGDETGAWDNNVAMKMTGTSKPADERSTVGNQDFGNTGVGYWFESRMIEVTNNKSISSDSAPFFIDGSGGQSATINIEDLPEFLLPYANALDRSGGLDGMVAARDIPVFRFDNNMATATHTGIWVEEGAGIAGRDIGALEHDIRSIYTNHRSYNIERSGFFVVNTSQVTAIDTIVSGTNPEDGVGSGIIGHAGQAFVGGAYQQAYEVALNGVY